MRQKQYQQEEPPQASVSPHQADPSHPAAASEARMGPERAQSVDLLGLFIRAQVQNYKRAQWVTALGLAGVVLIFTLFSMIAQHVYGKDRWLEWISNPWCYGSLVAVLLGASAVLFSSAVTAKPRFRRDVWNLARKYDLRSVGSLVDALGMEDGRSRQMVMESLIYLLPRLKSSDVSLLSASQQAKLRQIISVPVESPLFKNVEDLFRPTAERMVQFRIAILKAFEQVGDSKALPIVERLARSKARTPAEKRIQAAARECLPFLQARVAQETAPLTLLRASHRSQAGSESLVRPALQNPSTDPQELLRAGETATQPE